MALLESHPLLSTFAGVHDLECNGLQTSGNAYPNGILDHFEFSDGGALITLKESDATTGGGKRTEMSFKPTGGMSPEGEMWYSWEFMIPVSWGSSPTGFAIMQIHESTGDAVAVQFTLHYEAGQLVARVPVDVLTPGVTSYRVGGRSIVQGQWYSMCMRANWKLDATGSWELYVDRIPMIKRFNFANAYDRVEGGYLKLGVYNFNSASGDEDKQLLLRNVVIRSGNDGYQASMGGVPRAPYGRQKI